MSSPFLFLPRTVSKPKALAQTRKATSNVIPTAVNANINDTEVPKAVASQPRLPDKEYCALIHLALSDYALWTDPELRQLVATSRSPSDGEPAFIPLRKILRRSKILASLDLVQQETAIAKSIRAHASQQLELRLLVSDPTSRDVGVYEIRRRDWEAATTTSYTRAHWEERTIYVERIPSQFKSIGSLILFITSLLPSGSRQRIQGVIFPPHHRDKPEEKPTYKGFALFVLDDLEDVNHILDSWSWSPVRSTLDGLASPASNANAKEALTFGLRTLSKSRWNELRAEYQAFNRRLIDEINTYNDAKSVLPTTKPKQEEAPSLPQPKSKPEPAKVMKPLPALHQFSKFPPNSLVFVRNLHPETNKTTLRKLFGVVSSNGTQQDGIDYVDYTKGMDSCHLRFATAMNAQTFVDYYSRNPTIQESGLDETGAQADESSSASAISISVELVTGRREGLYWEKVPEKVRFQAVQKALQNIGGSTGVDDGKEDDNTNTKKRKKR